MGRVGRFILKVAAVLILIVSAGTFALSLFTGETRNGDNLQREFDYLITVGISQSGEESSWKDANTASFMDTFVKSNGYEAVYADAGSDQEKQIEDVEGFIKQGVDYIILNPISEIGWDDVLEDAKKAHIPVILVNNGVDTDDSSLYSCMLGSDYGKQMKKAGKWLDEYLKEEEEKKAEKEKAASEAPTQEESEQTDSEDTEVNTDSSKATDSSASIFDKIMKSSSTAKDEADLTEEEREYVLCHERIHIKRHDMRIKQGAFVILCLHWFNPLVWLAFRCMEADMESSCDEKVLEKMGTDIKKGYSLSLVRLSA